LLRLVVVETAGPADTTAVAMMPSRHGIAAYEKAPQQAMGLLEPVVPWPVTVRRPVMEGLASEASREAVAPSRAPAVARRAGSMQEAWGASSAAEALRPPVVVMTGGLGSTQEAWGASSAVEALALAARTPGH